MRKAGDEGHRRYHRPIASRPSRWALFHGLSLTDPAPKPKLAANLVLARAFRHAQLNGKQRFGTAMRRGEPACAAPATVSECVACVRYTAGFGIRIDLCAGAIPLRFSLNGGVGR